MSQQPDRQRQRVIVLTPWCVIEGTYHFKPGIRLSDSVNSELSLKARYLSLVDVIVNHSESGREILRTRFFLIAHAQILGISPKSEVTDKLKDHAAPGTSPQDIDQLVDEMHSILSSG